MPALSSCQQNHVLYMRSVREHVYRLHDANLVVGIHQLKVACLGSRVATDVDNAPRTCAQDGLHNTGVHACTRRVCYDYVWPAVGGNELVGEYVLHVAGIEPRVVNVVELRVDLGIGDGLWNIFYADYLPAATKLAMVPVPV